MGFILLSSQGLSSRFRDRIGLNSFSPLLCLSTLETKKIVYFDIKFIQSFDMRHSRSSSFWFKHRKLLISIIRIVPYMGVILILIHFDIILGSMQCEEGRSTIIVLKKLLRWAKLDVVGSADDQQACIYFKGE